MHANRKATDLQPMRPLKTLLICMIVYIPNQALFRTDFTVKGFNTVNLLFVLTLILVMSASAKVRTPPPLKPQLYFFFLTLTWGFLIGQAYDSSAWLEDLTELKNSIFYMLLFLLVYNSVHDIKTVRLLFFSILFVTFFASFQGLRQALDYGLGSYNESRRVAAPFGWNAADSNRAAAFFCIFLPLFAAAALFCKSSGLYRWIAFACLGLGVFVDFFTYSRQSYFILAALALVLTLRRSFIFALLIALAVANFEYWIPDSAVARIEMTTRSDSSVASADVNPTAGKYDESTESRLVIWEGASQLISSRPWGIGLNHFKREMGAYVITHAGMDAHNFYVLLTTETGLIGPIALLLLLAALYRLGRSVEKLDDTEESKILGIGFSTSVIAVAMSNIYGSRFLEGDVMGNFWIVAALVARYRSLVLESRVRSTPAPDPSELHARERMRFSDAYPSGGSQRTPR